MFIEKLMRFALVFLFSCALLSPETSFAYHNLDQTLHTWRIEQIGHIGDMLKELGPGGEIREVQINGHFAYLSYVYSNFYAVGLDDDEEEGRGGGLFIVDVSDPTLPRLVSRLPLEDTITNDVKINAEGTIVVLSGEPQWRSKRPPFGGVTIVDVSDKEHPRVLSRFEYRKSNSNRQWGDVHNVFVHKSLVFLAALDGDEEGIIIVDIEDPRNPRKAGFLPDTKVEKRKNHEKPGVFAHDVYVQEVSSGCVFVYVSDWDGGVQIWDITVLSHPLRVGEWRELGEGLLNTHYARPTPTKSILVVGGEFSYGFSGFLSILDISEVQKPKLLSTWSIPGRDWQHQANSWTPHNFDVTDSTIFLANYSAGVWILDISQPGNPRIIGSFGPESFREPPHPQTRRGLEEKAKKYKDEPLAPKNPWVSVFSVEEQDGFIYVTDRYSGLYILKLITTDVAVKTGTSGE